MFVGLVIRERGQHKARLKPCILRRRAETPTLLVWPVTKQGNAVAISQIRALQHFFAKGNITEFKQQEERASTKKPVCQPVTIHAKQLQIGPWLFR